MRLTMSIRKALTDDKASRYRASPYHQRRKLLDEFVAETGYSRKYASHLLCRWGLRKLVRLEGELVELKAGTPKRKARVGRPRYDRRIDVALGRLWHLFDHMCGKRLAAALRTNLSAVAGPLGIAEELFPLLQSISPATIDRHLAAIRRRDPLRSVSLTQPATGLKTLIPVRTSFQWDAAQPGSFQVDTVGHDGGSSYGDFCFTLVLVDVCSGWTELRSLLNKAARWVKEGLSDIRSSLPFPLRGINSDSGGEFINKMIVEFCRSRRPPIEFTRSRPNRKNDNCYVEGKNDTAVRRHVGYARFSGEAARQALAAVYRSLCPLINHVYPTMRLIEKHRLGSKLLKHYDRPRTPFQRLIDDPRLDPDSRARLLLEHAHIDILSLTQALDQALARLASLPVQSPYGVRRSLRPPPRGVRIFG